MKFKLTQQEFQALFSIVSHINSKYVCADMVDKLNHVLMTTVYMKLYKMAVIVKPKYVVKLSEAEAISFWLLLNDSNLPPDSFEGNLITQLNLLIHQKFA